MTFGESVETGGLADYDVIYYLNKHISCFSQTNVKCNLFQVIITFKVHVANKGIFSLE